VGGFWISFIAPACNVFAFLGGSFCSCISNGLAQEKRGSEKCPKRMEQRAVNFGEKSLGDKPQTVVLNAGRPSWFIFLAGLLCATLYQ